MKGFIATALALVPELKRLLAAPVHLALTYDEEVGCKGVPACSIISPAGCRRRRSAAWSASRPACAWPTATRARRATCAA